ncbi:hypothetical protein DPMN_190868 [Dreissena polymorpha]|uniref:Uncharacterized protein n=1 Tax=Dreissena polymorpha TaxID=45954 RepID=A0A9D4BBY1_DREPO|nr:hypothetical protein DPMN_190868 [Dreissena polymorpha]
MNNTTSEVTTKTLATVTSPFIGNTSTCTTEGTNLGMVGIGVAAIATYILVAIALVFNRCRRSKLARVPPDEEHRAHFTKWRALKAAQQHQPVEAKEEAVLLQTFPEESRLGYMKKSYVEHVPSQSERENKRRKTRERKKEKEAQGTGSIGCSMVVERATSIPSSILYEQEKKLTRIPPMNTNKREEVDEGIEFDGNLDSTLPKLDGDSRPIIYPTEVDIPCLVFHKVFGNSATSESQPSTGEDFGSYFRSWNSDIIRTTATETEKAVIDDTGDTRDGTSSFINAVHEVSIGNSCFSDNPTSTQLSNVHHVISSSGEEPGRPEVVDLNTLTQELDAQTSQFDKYKIDVAGLPAYTYIRKLMEQIEIDANIGPDECKTGDCNETLQEIYQQIRAAYNNSGVPEDERPLIPNNDFNYPSNVNEISQFDPQVPDEPAPASVLPPSPTATISVAPHMQAQSTSIAPPPSLEQTPEKRIVLTSEGVSSATVETAPKVLAPPSLGRTVTLVSPPRVVAPPKKSEASPPGRKLLWPGRTDGPSPDTPSSPLGYIPQIGRAPDPSIDKEGAEHLLIMKWAKEELARRKLRQEREDASNMEEQTKIFKQEHDQIKGSETNKQPAPASVLPPPPTATVSVAPPMQAQSTSIAPPPSLEQTPEKRIALTSEIVSSATVETAPTVLAPPSLERTVTLVTPPILAQTPGSVTPRTDINDILKQARRKKWRNLRLLHRYYGA